MTLDGLYTTEGRSPGISENSRWSEHPSDHPISENPLNLDGSMGFFPQFLRQWDLVEALIPSAPEAGWSARTLAIIKVIVIEAILCVVDRRGAALGGSRCPRLRRRDHRGEQRVPILAESRGIRGDVTSDWGHGGR